MKKIFLILSLTLFSCYKNYHLPYINYSETQNLKVGMNIIEVQEILGEPLYVNSISKNKNQIEHAYSVRTKVVESNKYGELNKEKFGREYDVQSNNALNTYRIKANVKTSDELHRLIIVYEDNILVDAYTIQTDNQQIKYSDNSLYITVLSTGVILAIINNVNTQ
tara:strand:+ start:66 stop:560 length:495 start_codon:yes stop_codon:yes gene_type:complete